MAIGDIQAGKAFVEVGTRDKLDLRALRAKLRKFGNQVGDIGKKLTVASTAILAPLAAATKVFATMGDNLDKMANRTGFSTEALSELGFAAELSGSSLESLGAALFRLRRRVANAASGTGPAVRALEELKLEAQDLKSLSPEQVLFRIIDAMNALGNESRAAQLGFELFGDNLKDLFPLIKAGSGGIEEMRMEARRLGLTVSTEAATSAAELTDKMTKLIKVLKNAAFQIGAALSDDMIALSERLTEITIKTTAWIKDNRDLISTFAKLAARVGAVGLAFVAFSKILRTTLAIQSAIAIIGGGPVGIGLVAAGLGTAAAIGGGPEIFAAIKELTRKDLPATRGASIATLKQLQVDRAEAREFIKQSQIAQDALDEEKAMRRGIDKMVAEFKRQGERERPGAGAAGFTQAELDRDRRENLEVLRRTVLGPGASINRGGFTIFELLGDAVGEVVSRGTFSGVGARLLGRGQSVETRQLDELQEINANLAKLIAKEGPAFA